VFGSSFFFSHASQPPSSTNTSEDCAPCAAAGHFPAGVAAQATAIDNDFFAGRPHRQKLRQQLSTVSSFNESRRERCSLANSSSGRAINQIAVRPHSLPLDRHHFRRRNAERHEIFRENKLPRRPPGETPRLPYSSLACE